MFYIIYLITNLLNDKTYIGKHGVTDYLSDDGYMGSGKMILSAIKKYGKENFKKDILAICSCEKASYLLEIEYIGIYKKIGKCEYNIAIGGKGGQNGRKHTEIEKKKIAVASSEHWKREGYKENFSNKMKGRKRPKEVVEKVHNKLKGRCTNKHWYTNGYNNIYCENCPDGFYPGRIMSDMSVEKWRKSYKPRVGWHHSEETKKIIQQKLKANPSKTMLGKHHTEETKLKMSKSRKGKAMKEESKRKISNSKKGHIVSEETRIKIANSMKKRWEEGCFSDRGKNREKQVYN